MFGLSLFEIIFLAVLALVVIGPKQLPEVARTLGRFLTELRRTANTITAEMSSSITKDIEKSSPVIKSPPPPVTTIVKPTETKPDEHS